MPNWQSAPGNNGFEGSATRGFEALGYRTTGGAILMWRLNPATGAIVDTVRYLRPGAPTVEKMNITWGYLNNDTSISFPIVDASANIYLDANYRTGGSPSYSDSRFIKVDSSDAVLFDKDYPPKEMSCVVGTRIYGITPNSLTQTFMSNGDTNTYSLTAFDIEDLGFDPADTITYVNTGDPNIYSAQNAIPDSGGSDVWVIGPFYFVTDASYVEHIVFAHKFSNSTSTFTDHKYITTDTVVNMPACALGIYDGYLYCASRFYDSGHLDTRGKYKMPFPTVSTKCAAHTEIIHSKYGIITPLPDYTPDFDFNVDIDQVDIVAAPPGLTEVISGDSVFTIESGNVIGREFDGAEIFTRTQDFATTVNSLAWDGTYLCVLGRE